MARATRLVDKETVALKLQKDSEIQHIEKEVMYKVHLIYLDFVCYITLCTMSGHVLIFYPGGHIRNHQNFGSRRKQPVEVL